MENKSVELKLDGTTKRVLANILWIEEKGMPEVKGLFMCSLVGMAMLVVALFAHGDWKLLLGIPGYILALGGMILLEIPLREVAERTGYLEGAMDVLHNLCLDMETHKTKSNPTRSTKKSSAKK